MPVQIRYSVPSIQKMRASHVKKGSSHKAKGLHIATFFEDVIFCIVSALVLILLLFWLNNGEFRVVAPLFMAAGFFLWHISLSKGIRIALQWCAFGIEVIIHILCTPFKHLFEWILQKHKRNALSRHIKRCRKQRETYTKKELQDITEAAQRLLPMETNNRMQKGDSHAKRRKKTI